MENEQLKRPKFEWALPASLGIPPDRLRIRLDFFHQAVQMTTFGDDKSAVKMVSALDVAHALAHELSFGTGLLPENTLWWKNTKSGPETAIYEAPRTRILAVQGSARAAPERYKVPLPGFIFLCVPGRPPAVFAVRHRPKSEKDILYHAPLANVFKNGVTCGGSNRYPAEADKIVEMFFISFFTAAADLYGRSKRFPDNILDLWKALDKKPNFPLRNMVKAGTVGDLLRIGGN